MSQVNEFFQNRRKFGIKPGLERINRLLSIQGNPQHRMKAIHVAGTNGKGSTIHFLKNALIANGYRVGVFTSPSLDGIRGHILDNDQPIDETIFIQLFNQLQQSIFELDNQEMHPSEFEIITVLSFMYFASTVDIALIEAGMGGRDDTTNCFIPILSIITNVDKDHMAYLGDSLEQIAYHKAGIIKQTVPVIVGDLHDESKIVIEKEARLQKAPILELNKDFLYSDFEWEDNLQRFQWKNQHNEVFQVKLQMQGLHQIKNASVALKALTMLLEKGMNINKEKALKAIQATKVPGRFEKISEHPVVIIDGAHNLAGIQAFLETVSAIPNGLEKQLIFAGFKDKDLEAMITSCIPYFESITLTSFDHPRAAKEIELLSLTSESKVDIEPNWEVLLDRITTNQQRKMFFVTGSLHFITMVRKYFLK